MKKEKKVCLVTGGAKLIGKSICLHLAKNGWDVAIHYNTSSDAAKETADQIIALGRKAMVTKTSLPPSTDSEYRALLEKVKQELGDITLLVNNAAKFEYDNPSSITSKNLASHFYCNSVAPMMLTHALYSHWINKNADSLSATVINILDQKLWNTNPDFFSYTISKSALFEATHIMATSMAPILRILSISPGITLKSEHQSQANFNQAHKKTPLGKACSALDIAKAVHWLEENKSITGINLTIDGGQHLNKISRDVMFTIQ